MFKLSSIAILICTSASIAAATEFKDLIDKVPRNANAVLVIDVDRILVSKYAIDNNWKSRFDKSFADRPIYLPQESDKVVVAAQVDPIRGFAKAWEAALIGMKEPISMHLIARAEGGYTDEINGVNTAWIPSDAYFIEIDKHLLGMMAPANRQAISNWAKRNKKGSERELTEYLEAATKMDPKGPQIIMALDVVDAIQSHRVHDRLQSSEIVKKNGLDIDALAGFFSSMRGVVLEVSIRDTIKAKGRVEFDQTVPFKADVAQAFVLSVLDENEMELPGIEEWKFAVDGDTITFSGDLSNNNLRRVLSLLDIPSTKFSSLKDQDVEQPAEGDAAKNSQAYFNSIEGLLKDLRPKQQKANASDARWMEQYAAKIDKLPILHVDKDLLDYGENLSETLRIMAGTRRKTGMQGAVNSRHVNDNNGYDNGYNNGYGYGNRAYRYTRAGVNETINEQNTAKADARAAGTATKIEGWALIDNATVDIRRAMTERYNVEF
ncbi:MAG: hypothetical protein ACKVT0_19535 [Planctomycetaceae bacterium]